MVCGRHSTSRSSSFISRVCSPGCERTEVGQKKASQIRGLHVLMRPRSRSCSMKRMPTSNVTSIDAQHHSQLPEAPFLELLAIFYHAELLEQSLGLFRIRLQRQMRLLHTFLLHNMGGFQRTERLLLSNGTERTEECQGLAAKFDVAHELPFCYISQSFMLK